jgi:hypothetical protein
MDFAVPQLCPEVKKVNHDIVTLTPYFAVMYKLTMMVDVPALLSQTTIRWKRTNARS